MAAVETASSAAVTMMMSLKQSVVDSLAPFQNQDVLKDYMVQQATGSLHIARQEDKLVWRRRRLVDPHRHHHPAAG
jgi:hypothetical protein